MVRTPAKLTALLSEQSVSEQVQQAQLRVVRGNATEPAAVKDALQDSPGQLVSLIVSGVGGTPKFWPNPLRPTLDQPTICQDSMKAVVQAVKDIRASSPSYAPYAVAISTTGVDAGVDDVPLLMHPLYHWYADVLLGDCLQKRKVRHTEQ